MNPGAWPRQEEHSSEGSWLLQGSAFALVPLPSPSPLLSPPPLLATNTRNTTQHKVPSHGAKPLLEWLLSAKLRSPWGPMNRERQRLNQTRPPPAKEPPVSEGKMGAQKGQSVPGWRQDCPGTSRGLLLWGLGLTPQGRAQSTGPGHTERGPPSPPPGPRVLQAQHGPTTFMSNLYRLPPQRRFHHHLRRE